MLIRWKDPHEPCEVLFLLFDQHVAAYLVVSTKPFTETREREIAERAASELGIRIPDITQNTN